MTQFWFSIFLLPIYSRFLFCFRERLPALEISSFIIKPPHPGEAPVESVLPPDAWSDRFGRSRRLVRGAGTRTASPRIPFYRLRTPVNAKLSSAEHEPEIDTVDASVFGKRLYREVDLFCLDYWSCQSVIYVKVRGFKWWFYVPSMIFLNVLECRYISLFVSLLLVSLKK